MAKQLNVDLRFNADTSQAKKAIQDLQNTLSNLSSLGTAASTNGFNQQIASATVEANKLKVALTDAFNTKTGAIDLSKLQANLRQAGSSIEQVSNSLINMGPVGQRAFQQFAATIAQAQVPTMRLNGLLGEMWTTLKNVARFQISSSIIHGLIGGVQSAFSYAQNLNQSLNNIRIVTGDNVEKMAQFAREANNAAKALSSTTLDYTNASLIYYQQGLDDQAVKARTDVTVKLANVTRQSAEEVSSQMTAIWNNFDDGAHSMEYFADVITALGATTASSSAEIAQGLQKFAPIAGTIGLSYEKATAALAAIIATTRQSADTVGTGLRTIFSRFESLKLGETLEDGVDLNKYTNAMKTIGVNVLDANGKLREMDDILDDIAENWQKLDNTQKTAFATTVGGVRQYTNLMALFENWDKVQQNLVTATGAEGTLQGQADIYAESWEAARDRVKTALQGLYDSLINDDFFIDLLNGIEKLLTGVDRFVQSLGGAKGVILGVAAAILSFANTGVSNAISNMTYNIMSLTGAGQKRADEMRNNVINTALQQTTGGTSVQQAETAAMQNQVKLQQVLNTYGKEYNDIQRAVAQSLVQQQRTYDEQLIASQRQLQTATNNLTALRMHRQEREKANASAAELQRIDERIADLLIEQAEAQAAVDRNVKSAESSYKNIENSLKNLSFTTMTGADAFAAMAAGVTSTAFAWATLSNAVKTLGDESVSTNQKIQTLLLNIPMGLTMAANAWKNGFGKIWNGLKGNIIANNATALEPLLKNKYTINTGTKNANIYQTLLAGNKNNQGYAQAIADLKQIKPLSEERIAQLIKEAEAEALATAKAAGKTVADKAETEAILAKKIAQEGANKAAAISLLKYAAIAAAIAAVIAVIYLAVKAYNADATAAKKAAEAHKELQQKSKDAAQELQNIKDAFDGYDKAVDALNKCTKGTEEWYNALKAVNNEVLSIMENNPELAAQMKTHRENGMLVIDNQQELINAAQMRADNARNAAIMGAVGASSAQLQSNTTDFRRYFAAQYDEAGNQISGIAPEVIREALSNLDKYSEAKISEIADDFKEKIPSFQLDEFATRLQQLAKASDDLANQMENAANVIAESALGNEYSGAEKEIASEAYEQAYDRIYNEVLDASKGYNKGQRQADLLNNEDSIWQRYLKAIGQSTSTYHLASNAIQGDDTDRTYHFTTNTDSSDQYVNAYQMAAAIAAAEALEKLTGSAEKAQEVLQSIDLNDEIKDDFNNFIANGNFEKSTQKDFEELFKGIDFSDVTNIETQKEEIKKQFGSIFENIAEAEGFTRGTEEFNKKVDEYINNFYNAGKNYSIALQHVGDNIILGAKNAFDNIKSSNENFKNLTLEEQNSVAELFNQAFKANGQEGLTYLTDMFNNAGDKADELSTELNNIDWQTTSVQDLVDIFDKLGITNQILKNDTEAALPVLEAFIKKMRLIAGVGIEGAQQTYQNSIELREKYNEGKELTEEDFAKLIELAGSEDAAKAMVTQNAATGNYIVTNPSEFLRATGDASQGYRNFIENSQDFRDRLRQQEARGYRLDQSGGYYDLSTTAYDLDTGQYDKSKMQAQLDFLNSQGHSEWGTRAGEAGDYTPEQIYEISQAVAELVPNITNWNEAEAHNIELLNSAIESQLASATSVGELQDRAEEYSATAEQTQKGYIALAQSTEEGRKALQQYNNEMEDAGEDAEAAAKATKKFQKAIKDIQARQAAKNIRELKVDLNNLSDWDAEQIATQLQSVFGKGITKEFVQNHKDWVNQWLNGTEEQRQAIADVIETVTDMQGRIDNTIYPEDIVIGVDDSGVEQVLHRTAEDIENWKQIIESHPWQIDATGHADMTDLIQELNGAGMTAEEIANLLASISETEVQFDAIKFEMPPFPENGTPDAVAAWMSEFSSQMAAQGMDIERFDVPSGGIPDMTSGGGGGGGSKAKTHTRKQRDNNDRYKPILAKQDDKQRQIDAAKDRADRLAGKARIDNLREENKLLGDNIELQKEYINEITNYLAQDKNDMVNALAGFGLTIDFDPNGVINNYDAIMDKLYEIYNQKADQAMDEDAWKKFEDSWQNAIDAVNQYIETRDLEEEQQENLNDMLNEQLDQLLEIVNTELELNIQVNDQDLNLLDHLLNKVNDDAYKAAEAIALMGDKAAKELERANYYQNAINNTLAGYGLDSVDQLLNMSPEELQGLGITQDTVDNLIDWNNELLDITETLDDLQKEIREKVIDTFDELNEKVQDSYDFFSHYNTLLESYRNIADLNTAAIGKESRELIRMLDNSMLRNSQNALRSSKQIYDKLVEDRQIAQQKLQEAEEQGLIGEADAYRDLIEDIDGQIRDAQEQWLADWEDGLEKAKDILERSVEDAVKNYEELLAPLYGSLDALNDVYEMRKEVDADYVQDYEKLYQLNKLNRDLEKTLNDVQGIQNRKQLLALQEKINKLQKDGTKMSEYDLEVLEKEFEVQQARIALEEAANAKSTVRLQRDNEGNWGYVYAADADTIEEAQQNYEDKLYEYQKLNDEYIREMSDKLMELSSTAKEKIAEVWADSTLSPEEKQAKTDEIVAWFNAQRDFIGSQMQNALDNQQNLTQRFYDTYQNTYAEVMDTYQETMLAEATKIDNLNEWLATLSTGFNNLLDEVQVASDVYLEHIAETNEAAGSSIEDLASDITEAAIVIDEASLQNVENIEELAQAVQDGLVNALDSAIEQEARLAQQIADTTTQIEEQYQAWDNVLRVLNNVGDAAAAAYYPLDTLARSTEQYGISQPSYNPDDWVANEQISGVFDEIYNQDYWQQQHQYADELQDAIQEWMSLLSMQALTAMGGFGTLTSPYYQEAEDGTLQQEVHIEANFPGVIDRSQIEEAFENLVNKAAQFANRKRQG